MIAFYMRSAGGKVSVADPETHHFGGAESVAVTRWGSGYESDFQHESVKFSRKKRITKNEIERSKK
jgi:hypothetical protein